MIDTNDGRSGSSSRIARQSCRSPSAVLGGKNSNEKVGPCLADQLPDRRLRIGKDGRETERHAGNSTRRGDGELMTRVTGVRDAGIASVGRMDTLVAPQRTRLRTPAWLLALSPLGFVAVVALGAATFVGSGIDDTAFMTPAQMADIRVAWLAFWPVYAAAVSVGAVGLILLGRSLAGGPGAAGLARAAAGRRRPVDRRRPRQRHPQLVDGRLRPAAAR